MRGSIGMQAQATEGQAFAHAAAAGNLLNVVYRSRAVQPLAGADLQGLVAAAQVRNNAESITGLVLYDEDRFYQWLEGPSASLDKVMRSINSDGRHTDISVLTSRQLGHRTFRGWDLQLAAQNLPGLPDPFGVVRPSGQTVERLRADPDSAPEILAGLAPSRPNGVAVSMAAEALPKLIESLRRPEEDIGRSRSHGRAGELAGLLVAGRGDQARELVVGAAARTNVLRLFSDLVEPAIRHMGDLWADDACREADLTIGLCVLSTIVHDLCCVSGALRDDFNAPRVLIAACPGEKHSVAGLLDAEALWHQGWAPRVVFPRSRAELQEMVRSEHFDCVLLGLSAAFAERPGRAVVAEMIDGVRRSSIAPTLAVVVSGRAVADRLGFAGDVGADAGSATAARVAEVVRHAVDTRGLGACHAGRGRLC